MNIFKKQYIPPSERPQVIKASQTKSKRKFVSMTKHKPVNKGSVVSPNLIHHVLSKMAFGPSPEDTAYIEGLSGNTTQDKIFTYIDEQLDFTNIDDSSTDALLGAGNGFTTLNKTRQQLYQDHIRRPDNTPIDWEDHIRPSRETIAATFIRATHSKRQLFETMTDFWHNHFSVYVDGDGIPGMFVYYDREVIRANALGNFYDMLYAVTRSTSMMMYLGNATNNVTAPNENFARELLELHTLGAANYYGHMAWQDVPTDGQGRRLGYVERDVYYMARLLTGWSYDGAHWSDDDGGHAPTGEFLFREDWHYDGISRILGEYYEFDPGNPEADVVDVLQMLAAHPGTANFLATKMCRRFIADNPTPAIVNQVANVLQQNWDQSNQIALAMDVLLKSTEFLNTWGKKVKRPFEKSIAVMRQIGFNYSFNPTQSDTNTHRWVFADSGGYPFSWTSPNGYPDTKAHWLGSSSQMMTWRYIQWFCKEREENTEVPYNSILSQTTTYFTNTNDITANNLVNYWYERLCGIPPDAHSQDRLAHFMSLTHSDEGGTNGNPQGRNMPIDLNSNDWPGYNQERLFALVATICMTAEFSYR
ncbi:MAG: DUF1800 domain-containing protein [Marinicella sp.]|nr:DUF1800 domain-containing protein [Xanthomonadales bacterium]